MKEQFCTYEISKKLKELGFDEPCLASYFEWPIPDRGNFELSLRGTIHAPLWQQAIDWFREKHNISISVAHYGIYGHAFSINFIDNRNFSINLEHNNIAYPKAREQAILKALDLLNNDL